MMFSVLPVHNPIDQGLAPGYQPFKERYTLDSLIQDIKRHLGASGGISSEEVDEEYLISLAQKYISDPSDWISYFHNDTSKNYTRNAIENINHKANILLLVWNPGKGSPIHDHANAHCIMKVLAGQLHETVYHSPSHDADRAQPLTVKSSNTFGMNEVTYISDDIGLHRVHNPSPNQVAVSLHLYTPPNAADYGYNIFDEATGRASYVSQAHSVSKAQGKE
ncbi:Cysteine dioxygenase [Penicillium capsulatum]|uniref:Cysteine dioxygenase n=1 Tax=Penicillium capsulatum TaxID=69766 RepID=A0A9W9IN52_9EURO|nr:Cysteine dioxygenase [Penicillium capsulatum]KAJ6123427.1 Cysteine dioxygenase [Penicillium capsulatum]